MRDLFTLKLMLISLLTAMSMVAKAEYIEYKTKDGLCYELDTETKSAVLSEYEGSANKVVIPKSVVYKGVPYDVTSLDDFCFAGCSSLTSITIPPSVTSLGDRCFWECSSLTTITIPSSVTSFGDGCFFDCTSLASITVPSSVTSLGDYCFLYCSSLASFTIPSSVTSLGNHCFANCSSLTSITIPSSVTDLEIYCFKDCSSLKTIICEIPTPIEGDFFHKTPIDQAMLYVPSSSLSSYRSSKTWNEFRTIQPIASNQPSKP